MTTAAALEAICTLPDAYHGWSRPAAQRTWRELVSDIGYAAIRPTLTKSELTEHLRAHPELVEMWERYSDAKHGVGGWYLVRGPGCWVVGRLDAPGGSEEWNVGTDPATACAEYILRELDSSLAPLEERRPPPMPGRSIGELSRGRTAGDLPQKRRDIV